VAVFECGNNPSGSIKAEYLQRQLFNDAMGSDHTYVSGEDESSSGKKKKKKQKQKVLFATSMACSGK
jgi:hypothetical protein